MLNGNNALFTEIFTLLASLGLSLSAGVRAYLPILALGIASHLPALVGFQIQLRPEFAWVGNPFFLGLIGLLTIYEISADKIPVVDHLNDAVHTIIRPISGALLFTATANPLATSGSTGAIIAAIIGAGLAGTTHFAKAGVIRPASTVATAGLANPVVSLIEDVFVIFTTILALVVPVLGIIFIALMVFLVVRGLARLAQRRQQRAAMATSGQTHGM